MSVDIMLWLSLFVLVGILIALGALLLFGFVTRTFILDRMMSGDETAAMIVKGQLVSYGLILGATFSRYSGLKEAVIASLIGIVLNLAGYVIWEVATPKWSLKEAVLNGNKAVGHGLQGWFMLVGLVIAGTVLLP